MLGFPDSRDRKWILHTPDFDAEITDYNWELTGYDERLSKLDPDVFHYSGNAYYITGTYAQKKGWHVSEPPAQPDPTKGE